MNYSLRTVLFPIPNIIYALMFHIGMFARKGVVFVITLQTSLIAYAETTMYRYCLAWENCIVFIRIRHVFAHQH